MSSTRIKVSVIINAVRLAREQSVLVHKLIRTYMYYTIYGIIGNYLLHKLKKFCPCEQTVVANANKKIHIVCNEM